MSGFYLKIRENLKSDEENAENLKKELGRNSEKLWKMSASEKLPTFSSMSQNLQKIFEEISEKVWENF